MVEVSPYTLNPSEAELWAFDMKTAYGLPPPSLSSPLLSLSLYLSPSLSVSLSVHGQTSRCFHVERMHRGRLLLMVGRGCFLWSKYPGRGRP